MSYEFEKQTTNHFRRDNFSLDRCYLKLSYNLVKLKPAVKGKRPCRKFEKATSTTLSPFSFQENVLKKTNLLCWCSDNRHTKPKLFE